MNENISLINGEFKQTISVFDRGLAYGDGLFETMVWHKSGSKKNNFLVEFWDRHINRLKTGCKKIRLSMPSNNLLDKYRKKILNKSYRSGLTQGILKIIITRGEGSRGYKFNMDMKPTIIFLSFPLNNDLRDKYSNGVDVRFCKTEISNNKNTFGIKHLNRLDSVLARSEWDSNYFDGVFVDSKGNLLEGTMTNIFFTKNSTLFTPNLVNSGIHGVMREVIIEKAKFFFQDFKECEINKSKLANFDGMFLTNSVIKILPVKKCGKFKFKISEDLLKLVENFYQKDSNMKEILELS